MTEMDWDKARHRSLLQLRAYHRAAINGNGLSIEYSVKAVRALSEVMGLHYKTHDDLSDYPADRCFTCGELWPCDTAKLVLGFCGHVETSDVADLSSEV